jgi:hypothetical protein
MEGSKIMHIPHAHAAFAVWAAIAGVSVAVIVLAGLGGLLRRHAARLAGCSAFGAAVAIGVTGWFGGMGHARLARAAAHPAPHQAAVTVNGTLASAFTVTFLVVTVLALVVVSLAGRRRYAPARQARPGRRYAARGW